ncbi:ubiquitin carboxyl-terminal hydrolase 32 isoform X2 [Hydra vulgaris]|uniref:ubiquitin carboxyl-terminal hydrolase 32 isoform X2 n=1 Tax=Hydra vulgaris TaxID=6087 RepID=UPI001F5F5DE2|nr:ubiquitin carboxyl-terminal hydrolase 32 isoform X2 [Hydra vulgaris]
MGAKESRILFLKFEDAQERVSHEELQRIENSFKRIAGSNSFISKQVFCSDVLGDSVPIRLAEQIYLVCGGTSKGISYRDVMLILVLITKGTVDEKVKFIFSLMSMDGVTVTQEDMENFYSACDGGCMLASTIRNAFVLHEKLFYNDFHEWLLANVDFCSVTRWLLEEQLGEHGVKLSSTNDVPSFYKCLANISMLSESDIVEIEKRYWQMKSCSKSGYFDFDTFKLFVSPPFPDLHCQSFFNYFDLNNDQVIDLKEMICGISTLCRGSTTKRLKASFAIFDINLDNNLCNEELNNMVSTLHEIYLKCPGDTSIAKEEIIQGLVPNEENKVTFDQFRIWASTSSHIHEFLLLIFQICHISFGLRPALKEEEGLIVGRWLERDTKEGLNPSSLYYIVSMDWWKTWMNYVKYEDIVSPEIGPQKSPEKLHESKLSLSSSNSSISGESSANKLPAKSLTLHGNLSKEIVVKPGCIDNHQLLVPNDGRKLVVLTGEGGKLKSNQLLILGTHYEVVSEPVWKALLSWYGANVALPRTVLKIPGSKEAVLELYPIQVFLYRHMQPAKHSVFYNSVNINHLISMVSGNNDHSNTSLESTVIPRRYLAYTASFSRKNTLKQILEFISLKMKVNLNDLRLWKMQEKSLILLEEEDKSVEDLELKDGSHLLIEIRNQDLSWPEEMNVVVATRNFKERSYTGLLEKGATGLHNLGNTCFMNSAIQCLSNTNPLTKYFLSKFFLYELNKTNRLGMKGVLAKKYGDLTADLWSGFYRSIAPVKLRFTIGKYAPCFNGFQQHDSQELLSFLLDGLHEDLNRVHDKPYVELKDSNGRPDDEVAYEAWQNHIKRNQSIVVDLFQGQLKSQVRCLHCQHISVRFDPFIFLSLPLPLESLIHLQIPVFLSNHKTVLKYGLLLSYDATIAMARKELAKLCNVESLLLVEIIGGKVQNILYEFQKVSSILAENIYAYEIDDFTITYLHKISEPMNVNIKECIKSVNHSSAGSTAISSDLIDTKKKLLKNVKPKLFISKEKVYPTHESVCNNEKNNEYNFYKTFDVQNKDFYHSVNGLDQNIVNDFDHTSDLNHTKTTDHQNHATDHQNHATDHQNHATDHQNHATDHQNHATDLSIHLPDEIKGTINTTPVHKISSSLEVANDCTHTLVIAMNRKMIQSNSYFVSWQKYRPITFGIPVVFACSKNMTNQDLYDCILLHVSRYINGIVFKKGEYPFEIKVVNKDCSFCSLCPWYKFCRGCVIQCDSHRFAYTSSYLAIDWDSMILHLYYQYSKEKFDDHISIGESFAQLHKTVSLDTCLKNFTEEEELGDDETWYCSKCNMHRKIAKKFDIWKLPPILVIHLKRFHMINNQWVKSNKHVRFPFDSFNPSVYMTKIKKSLSSNMSCKETHDDSPCLSVTDIKRFEETNGSLTSDINYQICGSSEENSYNGSSKENSYNLYAISCHSGILNGGHYVTYAKNPNGKWYYYNDSSCKEVNPSVLSNEIPYMLFYERQNLDILSYMPDIEGKQPVDVQIEEDEFEREAKKHCSIM